MGTAWKEMIERWFLAHDPNPLPIIMLAHV
jgi:hypothetical protein